MMTRWSHEALEVDCYAGAGYPERPRAFTWHGERHEVKEVERRWRTPADYGFSVRTTDGEHFTLLYHEREDRWTLRQ